MENSTASKLISSAAWSVITLMGTETAFLERKNNIGYRIRE